MDDSWLSNTLLDYGGYECWDYNNVADNKEADKMRPTKEAILIRKEINSIILIIENAGSYYPKNTIIEALNNIYEITDKIEEEIK